jgi:hypothetical protein
VPIQRGICGSTKEVQFTEIFDRREGHTAATGQFVPTIEALEIYKNFIVAVTPRMVSRVWV